MTRVVRKFCCVKFGSVGSMGLRGAGIRSFHAPDVLSSSLGRAAFLVWMGARPNGSEKSREETGTRVWHQQRRRRR